MRNAFRTELVRSITHSWGRFLAIVGIVALGCGFYAGLRMTGTDMRSAGNAFYDGTSLNDIRMVSTLGFSQAQVDAVKAIDGVDQVMPGYATDVMATLNEEQYAIRIMSLNTSAAAQSSADATGTVVTSSDDSYLNRLVLAEGSWPADPSQCVLSADRVMGTPIKVGDQVTVLYGADDLDGVLERRTYTVSGLVHSSAYVSSVSLGYTNLGSGIIQQYMYVSPSDFSADLPYTELYVTVDGAADEYAGSDAYQSTVDKVRQAIEDQVPSLAASRLAEVKDKAQATLDDKNADYESEKADAESQLADAKSQLDEALATLQESAAELESGQEEYDSGVAALDSARTQVASQLASAVAQLNATQTTLDEGEATLDSSQRTLDGKRSEWQTGETRFEQQSSAWATQKAQLQVALQGWEAIGAAGSSVAALTSTSTAEEVAAASQAVSAGIAAAGAIGSDADDAATALQGLQGYLASWSVLPASQILAAQGIASGVASGATTAQGEINTGIASGDKAIADAKDQLDAAKTQLDEAQATIDAKRAEIVSGRTQLASGWDSYYAQKATAEETLAVSQDQLDAAAAELASGRQQLADGQAEYQSGLDEYNDNVVEVDSRLADAASQLAEAQKDIDTIGTPDIYVLDRTKNTGVESYTSDSQRIDNIAAVFPFIFFLVAALVALTTMTRMIEDERVEIGTHKALGFSTARITAKYLAYAAIAGVAGSLVGILVLSQVLPAVVEKAYAIIYNVPAQTFPLPVNMPIALLSAGLGVGITLVATWAAAATTLRESPATLMLPRAPKAGKRILLERITPLWQRTSFSWKVTFRNLFRYKKRLAMTVIGIAGCTALLLTGLGLHDAIWDIIDNQYEGPSPVFHFNIIVGLGSDGSTDDQASAEQVLADSGGATDFALAEDENMQVSSSTHPNTLAVSVVIPSDLDAFGRFVTMRDRITQEPIAFDSHSVILTEKVATRLGLKVGDTFTLYDQDDIGNATGDGYQVTLTGITENYVYHYCYLGVDAWRDATGRTAAPDTIYTHIDASEEGRSTISTALHDVSAVKTVTFNTETIDSYRKSLQSVNMIVVVLVTAAAALAFIVLYNLTNINIVERTREIASLKVLGFTPREVAAYVFREIALLVVLGAAVGLVLGMFMETFVVLSSEVDAVMFGRLIHPLSFVEAFGLTLVFAVFVMFAMLPKLKNINMVESLKSVD